MRLHPLAQVMLLLTLCLGHPPHGQAQQAPQLLGLDRPRVGLIQRTRELGVNVFRNPSMGVEARGGPLSLHVGAYPTIISTDAKGNNETTWFLKAGATFFFLPHIVYGREVNELYLQAAYMRGLNQDWDHAFLADAGYRFMIYKGLNLRIGVALLVAPDHRRRINPTPGAGWSYSW